MMLHRHFENERNETATTIYDLHPKREEAPLPADEEDKPRRGRPPKRRDDE